MRKSAICLAALSAIAVAALGSAAQAGTVFDTSLTDPPGVFFGSGNFNDGYAVTTQDGVEIGLKSKIRGDASDSIDPVGDLYSIGLGNKVSFDYAVFPGSVDLSEATALLTILNVGTGQTFSFNPAAVSDNAHDGSAYENSEQIAFFPVGFSLTKNATYDITLSLSGVPSSDGPISVENVVKYGSGAVPEPASWALMMLGFGGIGATMRRSRKTAAAATA